MEKAISEAYEKKAFVHYKSPNKQFMYIYIWLLVTDLMVSVGVGAVE